ncbi:MAG: aminotransferase class IV [Flavobacteriaceae bacterium]
MYPLFESVCIENGIIGNAPYHELRFVASYTQYYGKMPPYSLLGGITIPTAFQTGMVKGRISYGKQSKEAVFIKYQKNPPNTLKVVQDDTLDYSLKYSDRRQLDHLRGLHKGFDDVLIVKNGFVTDTSYANIVFFDGCQWHTPSTYLLNGTCRRRLLVEKAIRETEIRPSDLQNYQGFQIINAMLGFDPFKYCPIQDIDMATVTGESL